MAKKVLLIPWEACPHLLPPYLAADALAEFEATLSPHQREARRTGRPALGSGAIYQVPEAELLVDAFEIPAHWWRGLGMDVGWKNTTVIAAALDPDTDVIYLTGEYKDGGKVPLQHVSAINAMLPWKNAKIACDPAAKASSQHDGRDLFGAYRDLGLNLFAAKNTVWAGIFDVTNRMQTGRLKVFRTLPRWLQEYRLYRTETKSSPTGTSTHIVKTNDHLMDAMRYVVHTPGAIERAPSESDYNFGPYGEF